MCLAFFEFLGTQVWMYLTFFDILRHAGLDVPNFFGDS